MINVPTRITDEGFNIVVFDPQTDNDWLVFIATNHIKELRLLDDCVSKETFVGEDERGYPKWENIDLGPESDVIDKVRRHEHNLPDLRNLYNECSLSSGSLSFRLPHDSIDYFTDAASIDNYFLDPRGTVYKYYQVKCVMLLYKGIYYGHVWYFTSENYPDFCGIYGMKSSLVNLISRNSGCQSEYRKGVSNKLLNKIHTLATEENRKRIIVPWPLPPMIPILKSNGYIEHNETSNTPEKDFLEKMVGTNNYFTLNL